MSFEKITDEPVSARDRLFNSLKKYALAGTLFSAGFGAGVLTNEKENMDIDTNTRSSLLEKDFYNYREDKTNDTSHVRHIENTAQIESRIGIPIDLDLSDPNDIKYIFSVGGKSYTLNSEEMLLIMEGIDEVTEAKKNSLVRESRMKELGIKESDLENLDEKTMESLYRLPIKQEVIVDHLNLIREARSGKTNYGNDTVPADQFGK